MAINLRSPYYTSTAVSNTAYTTLDISIWNGSVTSPVTAQYNLRKSVVGTSIEVLFEISELIRDYLDITFDGDYSGQAVWVKTVRTAYDSSNTSLVYVPHTQIAFDGYWYFEEEQLALPSTFISNRELFVLEDNAFRIPIYTSNNPTVVFYKDGEVIASETFSSGTDSSNQIKYVSIYGDSVNWDTFQERVTDANGTYEPNACLQSFFDNYSIGAVDKITVSDSSGIETIKVNVIEECKYEPKKVTFINKFGALQDMYFFKKAVEQMTIEKESYKSNIISAYGQYSKSNHVNRDFNVVGKESITLSSGFLSEEYNEVFKQMMLSEKVWVTNILATGEQVLPINVKTSDITYKTSLNNKLVEYTIEFDKSFDTINNIR
tara:strand:- start:627 stop:1757 length:1131 start_codon:yes stop_codon:yes gene_type:complete